MARQQPVKTTTSAPVAASCSAGSGACAGASVSPGVDPTAADPLLRPRIAIVVASLDILGGHGVQARTLSERLRADGYRVDLIPVNPRFPKALRWLRELRYLRTLLNQAVYLPRLAALRHADTVHVFSASYWSFLLAPAPAMLVGRLLGKRVVLNYHSGEAEDHLARWGALVHPWLRIAHAIVVPSEFLQRVFARFGYRASVIPNIVDTSCFRYRERAPLRPRLLSTRNFERHYRVDVTLRAFALLRERYPEATLTVAGAGTEESRLRRLAAELAPDAIRFAGRTDPRVMPKLYDEADIFVNASVIDNQPLSVLEAFAAGLPVISTAAGGIAAMVRDGETGLIVAPDDPAAMAQSVAKLLENPQRALAMARRAKAELERHTWSNVRAAWAAAYSGSPAHRC